MTTEQLHLHNIALGKKLGKTAWACVWRGKNFILKTPINSNTVARLKTCTAIKFPSIVIPEYEFIGAGPDAFMCLMPDIGKELPWSELDDHKELLGGKALNAQNLFSDTVEIFENLAAVPIQGLDLPVTTEVWGRALSVIGKMHRHGYLTAGQAEKIRQRILSAKTENLILSNGDFYPRNIISTHSGNAKLALIDWDEALIEPAAWVCGWIYVHMWGLPEFQKLWRKWSVEHYGEQAVSDGILITGARLAAIWIWRPDNHRNALSAMAELLRQEIT